MVLGNNFMIVSWQVFSCSYSCVYSFFDNLTKALERTGPC